VRSSGKLGTGLRCLLRGWQYIIPCKPVEKYLSQRTDAGPGDTGADGMLNVDVGRMRNPR
jgi:hypothetical protein